MKIIKLSILLLLSISSFAQQNQAFQAKGLLFLSDADMLATSFYDNRLQSNYGQKDLLSGIVFPLSMATTTIESVVVSNSMLSHGTSIDYSLRNKLAYIIETKGEARPNSIILDDSFRKGQFITVVDATQINLLKPLYKFPVGQNPLAVSLSPDNNYLAVSCEEYSSELIVYELDDLGKPIRKIKKPNPFSEGKIVDIKWHPNGNYLVYTNESTRQIGLIKVLRDGPTNKIIRLQNVGSPVNMGVQPGLGHFTPDGRFFILPDIKKRKNDLISTQKSEVFVLKFDYETETNHFLMSKIEVGENFEDLAIHPNGSTVAVLSLNHSFYPFEKLENKDKASVTLLRITADGSISKLSETAIEGKFPSSLVFDKTGENVAICISEYATFGLKFGGIEFYKLINGGNAALQATNEKIFVPRGVHKLRVITD